MSGCCSRGGLVWLLGIANKWVGFVRWDVRRGLEAIKGRTKL